MTLKNSRELHAFLSTYFPHADPDSDTETTRSFVGSSPLEKQQQVIAQAKTLAESSDLSLEELGTEANRWFGDPDEARAWLRQIVRTLETAQVPESVVVKDSNGTQL